jgi:hypothetical protein
MNICAAIYARTSPDCLLTSDEQIAVLGATAAEQDWTVTHVLADRPTSIKQREDRRPGELALITAMRSGAVNKVLIWDIDRVGKSLIELVSFLEACRTASVSLYLHEQNIDTTSSNGLSLNDVLCASRTSPPTITSRPNSQRSGGGPKPVHQIWPTASREGQSGKSQAILDRRQGRAAGRAVGGYLPRVGQSVEEFHECVSKRHLTARTE